MPLHVPEIRLEAAPRGAALNDVRRLFRAYAASLGFVETPVRGPGLSPGVRSLVLAL